METSNLDVSATLRNRKFLALLTVALLVTYALPFPSSTVPFKTIHGSKE